MRITLLFIASFLGVNIVSAQIERGDELFEMGNFEEALLEYESEENEDDVMLNYKIAVCYLNTNIDKAKAVSYLELVTSQTEADPNAWYLLGRAYHYAYQFDKAIDAYQKFKSFGNGNEDNLADVDRQIKYCENAKELMKFPIDVSFENLGKEVNSAYKDYYPFVPADESFILFNSNRDEYSAISETGAYFPNIYRSEVTEGVYSEAKLVNKNINSEDGIEEVIGLSNDGTKALLYFDKELEEGNIFLSNVENGKIATPEKLSKTINTKYSEIAASLSADENAIYFASDRPGGYGGMDIYICRKLPNGMWSEAQNLGPVVNTELDEDFPNISPDGNSLYFSSKGHTSMGGYDIFKADWDAVKRKFTDVRNVGFPINTPEDNMNLRISETGRHGYISALREEGYGDLDIYRVQFNEVEPRYTVVNGKISVPEGSELKNCFISVVDHESGEIYGDYRPNENSMRYVIILPPGEFDVYVIADGMEDFQESMEILDKSSYRSYIAKDIELKLAN